MKYQHPIPRKDWENHAFMNDLFQWDERFPNFKPRELACKCCGLFMYDHKTLTNLQKLRDFWKAPLVITSGTRCEDHNKRVGGATNSLHLTGRAFDISTPDTWTGRHVASFIYYATHAEFRGIGLYSRWVHIDNGPHRTWEQGDTKLDPFDNCDPNELC